MSNNISTMYTKELNMKTGRKGWLGWKNEKETSIEPASYGGYLLQQRKHARYDILRGKNK
ncbi:MAG: hypothetical protein ACLTNR_12540 [Coprococcus sp.]|jgi:hypothetical protein